MWCYNIYKTLRVSWYFQLVTNRLICEKPPAFPEGPEILIIKDFLMFLVKKKKAPYVMMEIMEVRTECSDASFMCDNASFK